MTMQAFCAGVATAGGLGLALSFIAALVLRALSEFSPPAPREWLQLVLLGVVSIALLVGGYAVASRVAIAWTTSSVVAAISGLIVTLAFLAIASAALGRVLDIDEPSSV
jgi:hypothetical protein